MKTIKKNDLKDLLSVNVQSPILNRRKTAAIPVPRSPTIFSPKPPFNQKKYSISIDFSNNNENEKKLFQNNKHSLQMRKNPGRILPLSTILKKDFLVPNLKNFRSPSHSNFCSRILENFDLDYSYNQKNTTIFKKSFNAKNENANNNSKNGTNKWNIRRFSQSDLSQAKILQIIANNPKKRQKK